MSGSDSNLQREQSLGTRVELLDRNAQWRTSTESAPDKPGAHFPRPVIEVVSGFVAVIRDLDLIRGTRVEIRPFSR